MAEPSALFQEIFMGGGFGGPQTECCCGRVHYCDSPYYEPGELESLQKAHAAKPDAYVYNRGDDYVSSVTLFGRVYVRGCRCEYAAHVEQGLWNERDPIARYLKRRAQAVLDSVREALEL